MTELRRIRIRGFDGRSGRAPGAVIATDTGGRFAFRALEPGTYEIAFHEANDELTMGTPFVPVKVTSGRRDVEIHVRMARLDYRFCAAGGWDLHGARVSMRVWPAGVDRAALVRETAIDGIEGLLAVDLRAAWVPWGTVAETAARSRVFDRAAP